MNKKEIKLLREFLPVFVNVYFYVLALIAGIILNHYFPQIALFLLER